MEKRECLVQRMIIVMLAVVMAIIMGSSSLVFADDAASGAPTLPEKVTLTGVTDEAVKKEVASFSLKGATDDWMNKVTSVTVDGKSVSMTPVTADVNEGTSTATVNAYGIVKTVSKTDASAAPAYRLVIDMAEFTKTPKRSQTYQITIKAAGYPDVDAAVAVQNYGAETLYVRHLDKDGKVLSEKTYTMADIEKLADTKDGLYQSICSHHGIRSFRVTGVTLDKLLKDAGIDSYFKKGSEIRIRTNDASTDETLNDNDANSNYYPEGGFSYTYLSQKRYTFTDIYESKNKALYDKIKADQQETVVLDGQTRHNYLGKKMRTDVATSAKEAVKPLLAIKYCENDLDEPEAPEANYGATQQCRAFRFFYGIAMDPSDSKMIAKDETTMRISYAVYGIDLQDTDVHDIDRTALEKAVQSASKLNEADYTPESWAAFKTAYDDAKGYVYIEGVNQNVAHHFATDQATLEQKEQELKAAVAALVRIKPDTSTVKPAKKPAKTKIKSLKAVGKRSVKITWKKISKYNRGYKIRYSTKKSMKSSKVIKVKGVKTVRKVVKKLKRGRKYYFQICTYGTKGSSAWSGKRSVRVK